MATPGTTVNPTITYAPAQAGGQSLSSYQTPSSTQASTSAITPTPTTTSTTIPVGSVTSGNSSSLTLPSASSTGKSGLPAANNIGSLASMAAAQNNLTSTANNNEAAAQTNYNSAQTTLQGYVNQYLGEGQDELNQENAQGVPQKQLVSQNLSAQYNAQNVVYSGQYANIMGGSGSIGEKEAQIQDLQQQNGLNLASIAAQQTVAQADYTSALAVVQNSIQLKYAPLQDAIQYQTQILNNAQGVLTAQQANQFQANLQVQQQQYTQSVYYANLDATQGMTMVQDAAANGADPNTLSAMSQAITNGGSVADVAAASGGFLKSTDYTPIQTGIDSNTGLPIYSNYNTKTGQMTAINSGGILGVTGSADTTVGGYQFGATTTMGAYASNTSTQVNNIKNTVSKIASNIGTITDATGAQAALNLVSPNSPITGTMVMAAASQYNVDPATIIGVMQAETQCGTDGSTGSKENNWGNVGNTDSAMAAGNSVKMTPQQGVDAIAENLSKRAVTGDQTDPTQATSTTGLTSAQKAQVLKSSAPALGQIAIQTMSSGDLYVDASKVPASMVIPMNTWANSVGVKVLNSDQVAKVNEIQTAAQHIIDIIAPDYSQIAPDSTANSIAYRVQSLGASLGNTDYAANLKAFQENRETVAQQIAAISGGGADDATIKTAEDALPGAFDTLKQGNAKLNKSLQILNSNLQTYLGTSATGYALDNGSVPTPAAGTIQTVTQGGSSYKIKINPDGSSTIVQ